MIDSELGRISAQIINPISFPLQPKERIHSIGFLTIETKMCSQLSYRNAAEMINLVYHKTGSDAIKLRTLSDTTIRIGNEITSEISSKTEEILKMYGFNSETGVVNDGVVLSETICKTNPSKEDKEIVLSDIEKAINLINDNRDEKVNYKSEDIQLEARNNCIYISVDDIGVKRQKDIRSTEDGYKKDTRYVENTVAHIQNGTKTYLLTAVGMRNLFKVLIAFLLVNDLLGKEIVFFTDGARNIKSYINEMFSFHDYSIILDWYHLKKRCQEYLSMAIKGKEKRNLCLEKILRYLWVGDVDSAVSYLTNLSEDIIKNPKWINDLISYLDRKREGITCYAVRAKLKYRNSSNPVEKANDIIVAKRQKHNGMAWTPNGSSSLAAIEMIYQNNQDFDWFYRHTIPMFNPVSIACA